MSWKICQEQTHPCRLLVAAGTAEMTTGDIWGISMSPDFYFDSVWLCSDRMLPLATSPISRRDPYSILISSIFLYFWFVSQMACLMVYCLSSCPTSHLLLGTNWGKRPSAVVHFTYLTCSRRFILHLPTSESRLSFATRGGTTNSDVI